MLTDYVITIVAIYDFAIVTSGVTSGGGGVVLKNNRGVKTVPNYKVVALLKNYITVTVQRHKATLRKK